MGIQDIVPVYEHEFKGTYSGEEKGKVKIQYYQIYNKETDTSTFKIISLNSLSIKYTGEYSVQGKITITYGENSVSKDLISWNDENPSNDINNINFTELNTYYELTNNDGTSIELSLEVPNASQATEPIKIQLSRASEATYGLLFYNNSNDPDGWQVLDEQASSNDGYAEIDIIIPTDEPEGPAPDEPEGLISLELNPKFLFMGWNFARQFDFRRFGSGTDMPVEPIAPYLTFASAEPFTIGVNNATKNWDGTLYYSTDTASWNEWDGKTAIASAEHCLEQRLYMRGSGNSIIIGSQNDEYRWVLTGNNIRCEGNIENLLDYETVAIGEHPDMYSNCYYSLFMDCTSLITAPELPATTLASNCYKMMFRGCTSLTQAPKLPATTLGNGCYENMFMDCTSLVTAPELPATTLIYKGYRAMFLGCTSLTQVPKLSATTAETYCCQYMFKGCTSIKISATQTDEYTTEYRIPTSGTIEDAGNKFKNMFTDTGGPFTGTPEINKTYYLHKDNAVVGREPIAYLYGHVAKEGETPTHIINGVGYAGGDT